MSSGTPFAIEETVEAEGVVRLAVVGELDLATRPAFQRRLSDMSSRYAHIRLDLSRLYFVDASGLTGLVGAIAEARKHAWRLEVDRGPGPEVKRLLAVVGMTLP